MTGKEIEALRESLGLTARTLGAKLGVEAATVIAWEREETFPTRRHVRAMEALRDHPAAPERRAETVMEALSDPEVWSLLRKLLAHPELRRDVKKLAEKYEDPRDSD